VELGAFIERFGAPNALARWAWAFSHSDPSEIESARDKQLSKMARYHRQDWELMMEWDLEVFWQRFQAAQDLLREESAAAAINEH